MIIKVQRANVQLSINEEEKDSYLARGFDVINEKGEITESSPEHSAEHTKIEELTKQLNKANEKIKELKAQIKELTKV